MWNKSEGDLIEDSEILWMNKNNQKPLMLSLDGYFDLDRCQRRNDQSGHIQDIVDFLLNHRNQVNVQTGEEGPLVCIKLEMRSS